MPTAMVRVDNVYYGQMDLRKRLEKGSLRVSQSKAFECSMSRSQWQSQRSLTYAVCSYLRDHLMMIKRFNLNRFIHLSVIFAESRHFCISNAQIDGTDLKAFFQSIFESKFWCIIWSKWTRGAQNQSYGQTTPGISSAKRSVEQPF